MILSLYQQLYEVDDQSRAMQQPDQLAVRQAEGMPIWTRLEAILASEAAKQLAPKDKVGEAVELISRHLPALREYLSDHKVPIDNNDVEQLMKRVAVGRTNWLFIGSVPAGEQPTMLITLTSSALRNDLHMEMYLKGVLDALLAGTTDYELLSPEAWTKSHPEAIRDSRQEERAARKTAQANGRNLRHPKPASY